MSEMESEEETGVEVCLESELEEGQMREVVVGKHSVLLLHTARGFSAVGNRCPHYGAPLSKGALSGDRVRCPWHGACFNIHSGDIEEYPGLDCLPRYEVKVESNKVFVLAGKQENKRVKVMARRNPKITHTVMLLGAGPAALVCAETLRQENYGGRIIMVTREGILPYDKPKLSKMLHAEPDSIILRPEEFFQKHDIEVWTKKEVISVDSEKKTVTLSDGSAHHYNQLLISTGCRARRMDCPGSDLKDVKVLEQPDDATSIHQSCMGRRAIVVGSSFIGMEVASYLADKAASITVVGSSTYPYEKTLGPEVGKVAMQMLQTMKVKFCMEDRVIEIRGEGGKVKEVVLQSGVVLPADIVIAGIGVIPNAEFLNGSSVKLDKRKYVIVDKFMKTNVPDVFCAGDVCSFPLSVQERQMVSLGHWHLAQAQGRVAAFNMLKKPVELKSVPFYWTVLAGKSIRYAGYGEGYTDIVMKGGVEELKFLAFYIKDDEVVAAASLNFDPAVAQVAERMAGGIKMSKAQAESDNLSWLGMP